MIKGSTPPVQRSNRPTPQAPSVIGQSQLGSSKPKKQIIEREIVGATQEARRLVQEAEIQAQRIIEEAHAQAEQTRTNGYDEGYQEGLGQYTEQLSQAIIGLRKREEALEGEFVKLVRVCVEKILAQEIKLHPDAVVGIVRNALHDARQQREIIIRMNPQDAEECRKNKRRLLEVLARANEIEIREDPSIGRGGCIVVTELGTIDASLERQLAALEKVVEEEYRAGGSATAYSEGAEESELDPEDDPGYGG